jgi:UPF0755 protein
MKILRVLFVLVVLACGTAAGAAWWWLNQPLALAADTVEISIDPGTPPRDIARAWVQAGVQASPLLLYEWFRWSGEARRIRAGSYEIGRATTPVALLRKMVRGDETLAVVRFNEGWTFRQVRAELAKAESLKPQTATMSEAEIMQALGAPGVPAEGRFYPDTYAYSKGSADLAVLRRAFRAMQRRLDTAWQQRAAERDLRARRIVRRQPAQARPAGRHAAQHLPSRRPAADADRDAGPAVAAGRRTTGADESAVLRVARRRQQRVQRQPRRA